MHLLRATLLGAALLPAAMHAKEAAELGRQGWYADPEIHIFGGKYWIYPTYSGDGLKPTDTVHLSPAQVVRRNDHLVHKAYLTQTFLDAFSSTDLVHWTKHDHVLDVKNVTWAAYAVWAPTAIALHGKYYLLFAANDIQKDQSAPGGIGVAVSNSPGGPFLDALGKPLIHQFENGAQPIDPAVFRDDDGSLYLYYGGQGHCNVTRLSADLTHVIDLPNGTRYKEITPEHYTEGPFMLKRSGTYYFMWSEGDWGDSSYRVAYARSASPTGPFQRVGTILQSDPQIASGAGHHSVLHLPGTDTYYIVYHRHPLGDTNPNHRTLAIDRLFFNADGTIAPVRMTQDGVPAHRLTMREAALGN